VVELKTVDGVEIVVGMHVWDVAHGERVICDLRPDDKYAPIQYLKPGQSESLSVRSSSATPDRLYSTKLAVLRGHLETARSRLAKLEAAVAAEEREPGSSAYKITASDG
jgi:hypothetical protein